MSVPDFLAPGFYVAGEALEFVCDRFAASFSWMFSEADFFKTDSSRFICVWSSAIFFDLAISSDFCFSTSYCTLFIFTLYSSISVYVLLLPPLLTPANDGFSSGEILFFSSMPSRLSYLNTRLSRSFCKAWTPSYPIAFLARSCCSCSSNFFMSLSFRASSNFMFRKSYNDADWKLPADDEALEARRSRWILKFASWLRAAAETGSPEDGATDLL